MQIDPGDREAVREFFANVTHAHFLSWPIVPGQCAVDGQPVRRNPFGSHDVWLEGCGPISPIAYAVRRSLDVRP